MDRKFVKERDAVLISQHFKYPLKMANLHDEREQLACQCVFISLSVSFYAVLMFPSECLQIFMKTF